MIKFKHHIIDDTLPSKIAYAQTAVGDIDNCGKPEYITGQQSGSIFCYKYNSPSDWTRFLLGENSPSDVGGALLDVDNDGWLDYVAGGAWYRNSRDLSVPFERIVFDPELGAVHDLFIADIDGDGRADVVTMSDKNNLRWYKIPQDPTRPWIRTDIGPSVHAGVAIGDLTGNGSMDIVRTDIWYENVKGDGSTWVEHPIGPNTPPPPDCTASFFFNATRCHIRDMNGNGANDIVFVDAEIPGGKIWWMENVNGDGSTWVRHDVADSVTPRRGAYHGIVVGDLDGDGDYDIFACEMEGIPGEKPPRWYVWENLDGKGLEWKEHVIFDENLGGHDPMMADFTGDGTMDIITKPWRAQGSNALGGKTCVVFLENLSGVPAKKELSEGLELAK